MALQKLPEPDVDLPRSWWARYWTGRIVGKALSRLPNHALHLARVEQAIKLARRAALIEGTYRANRKRTVGAGAEVSAFTSGYGYDSAAEELAVAKMYKGQIVSGQFAAAETPGVMTEAVARLTETIGELKPRRVVNFGVSYAHIDSQLAAKFPEVQFIGIDRSQAVCDLNRTDFQLPNMTFVASDIDSWLAAQPDLSDCVFFHMRTAILLPQSFVEGLYSALSKKKIAAICGFEPTGVSRETNSFIAQSYDPRPSAVFRDHLYIHNYIGMLKACGYGPTYLNYAKTGHVDKDVRIVSFVAVKDE